MLPIPTRLLVSIQGRILVTQSFVFLMAITVVGSADFLEKLTVISIKMTRHDFEVVTTEESYKW